MTPQEIFDTVATHLFTQSVQSGFLDNSNSFRCFYRANVRNNRTGATQVLSCAIGCLISESDYRKEMDSTIDPRTGVFDDCAIEDGTGIDNLLKHFDHLPDWMNESKQLLIDLQDAHDFDRNWESDADMKIALRKIALVHDLNDSILDTLKLKKVR